MMVIVGDSRGVRGVVAGRGVVLARGVAASLGLVGVVGIMLATPTLAAPATHTVVIDGMRFDPPALTVARGDRVVWTNKDLVPHTATASGTFKSISIAPGKSWTWTAKKSGSHGYICTFHPTMKGTLVVR